MRTRKPAATSRGNTCHRCTALLLGDASQCSMCGWPAGVGYPPVDGELEAASAVTAPEPTPEVDVDAERAAAQLDALAGMAQRQSQPAPESEPEPRVESKPETVEVDGPPTEAVVPQVAEPVAEIEADGNVDEAVDDDPSDDVDPLTAPLDELPEPTADATGAEADETPIAAVAEAVVQQASHDDIDDEVADAPVDSVSSPENVGPADTVEAVAPTSANTAGRASSLARPVQLLVVAAAVVGMLLAAMEAAFGSPIDSSMTAVALGVSLLQIALWAAAAVTFLYWVSRAYREVAESAAYAQRHGPSMALIGWVIPIVGLFIGYRVLQDLWAGSDPQTRQRVDAKPQGARMIDVWLLGLITAALISVGAPVALGDSALWSGLSALSVLVAGLSLASVVGKVSTWQDTPDAVAEAAVADDGTVTTRVDELVPESVSEETVEPVPSSAE